MKKLLRYYRFEVVMIDEVTCSDSQVTKEMFKMLETIMECKELKVELKEACEYRSTENDPLAEA